MQATTLPPDVSTSHEPNIHIESVFSQTEEMSRGQEFNHFRAFLCEAVRSYITSQCHMQQHVPGIKKIGELATSWFANPDHTICQSLVSRLQVKCLYVQESENECTATQLGLFTILGGFGATDLKISKPFDNGMTGNGASCTQLIYTIEKNKKCFDIKENFCKFAIYGIGTTSTKLDGADFGGHSFTIVQYPSMQNGKTQIRYRLFQSYLNYYSLSDQIKSEKIQHHPDGSFSHDYCIDMLNKLERISQSKIWDSETDNLHNKLFRVSLPDLLGKKFHNPIPVTFHYKIVDNESFLKKIHILSDISYQMKSFVHLVLLSNEDYKKQLDNHFCPVIVESVVYTTDMNTNFDIMDRIAEHLDIKSAAPLGKVDRYHAAWWKEYITKNSEILTIFINNVYNTSRSGQEVTSRLCQLAQEKCFTTPFNLSIDRCCVDTNKLYAIQKKFPSINQLQYFRPFKISAQTALKRILTDLFPTCFSKADPSLGNDQVLGKIYKIFPKVQKLFIKISGTTRFGTQGITALPPFGTLKAIDISVDRGSFPLYPDPRALSPIDSSFQPLFCQYGTTLERLDLLEIGMYFLSDPTYKNFFRFGPEVQFKYIPEHITSLGIALQNYTELNVVLDRCKNLTHLKVYIMQQPPNGLLVPNYTSLKALEIIQGPADIDSIHWFFTAFPNMTDLKVMGKGIYLSSLDQWPSSLILQNLCIKVGHLIAEYDEQQFLQKFPHLTSHEIRSFPDQTTVCPKNQSYVPE